MASRNSLHPLRAGRSLLVLLVFLASAATAQLPTKSVTLRGATTRDALLREFPGATVTQRGPGLFEVAGLRDADITKLRSLSGIQRVATHGEVTPDKLAAMGSFCEFMTYYNGQYRTGLSGNRRGRIVCEPECGMYPGPVGKNCGDLKKEKEEAAKANAAAGEFLDMLQTLLQAYKEWAFWGGVAGMLGDMVSAAGTVLTAGGATPAVNAAAKILLDMGQNAAVGAIQEAVAQALGIPNLNSEAAVEAAVAAADRERVKTNQAYQAALKAWQDCLKVDLPEMTPAEMQAAQQAIDAWDRCWRGRRCRVVF